VIPKKEMASVFFSQYAGNVTIYWIELQEETDRKNFEIMMQEICETEFSKFE